jgi:hypothetical protein
LMTSSMMMAISVEEDWSSRWFLPCRTSDGSSTS